MKARSQDYDKVEVQSLLDMTLAKSDLPQNGWKTRRTMYRRAERKQRIVLLLSHRDGGEFAFKAVLHPQEHREFKNTMDQQLDLQHRMPGIPKIVAYDMAAQTVLMEKMPGTKLAKLVKKQPLTEHGAYLRQTGEWLARFHSLDGLRPHQFKPGHSTKHIRQLIDEIQAGQAHVPGRVNFLTYARRMLDQAPSDTTYETIEARCHGDLNCNNVILDGERTYSFDFLRARNVPVAYDVARLLVHYGMQRTHLDGTKGLIPGIDTSGFFQGYDIIDQDDGPLRLLVRVRLLNEWIKTPYRQHRRSEAEERRFRKVQRLCKRVFK